MNPKIDSTKKSWSNTKRLNHLSILVMENNTKINEQTGKI